MPTIPGKHIKLGEVSLENTSPCTFHCIKITLLVQNLLHNIAIQVNEHAIVSNLFAMRHDSQFKDILSVVF